MTHKSGKANSLAAIAHYNSSSGSEDDDALANVFSTKKPKSTTEWTKCFDKKTGHPYYWNTTTREVTWDIPDEYSCYLKYVAQSGRSQENNNNPKYWIACHSEDSDEVYYVNKITRIVSWDVPEGFDLKRSKKKFANDVKSVKTSVKTGMFDEEMDDESMIIGRRIEPIKPHVKKNETESTSRKTASVSSRRQYSKPEVPQSSNTEKRSYSQAEAKSTEINNKKETKPLPASLPIIENPLVPHYDVEDHDDSDTEVAVIAPVSQLFPVSLSATEQLNALFSEKMYPAKQPDLPVDDVVATKQRIQPKETSPVTNDPISFLRETTESTSQDNSSEATANIKSVITIIDDSDFDKKLFKRKKRIDFVPKPKNVQQPAHSVTSVTPELAAGVNGTATDGAIVSKPINPYNNFVKGGVELSAVDREVGQVTGEKSATCQFMQQYRNEINIVGDKLKFLGESTSPATSAQIMFIQFVTLMEAFETENLKESYLLKWIRETKSTLEKLEEEAVPAGWKCEWDRSSSRYVYVNLSNGTKQYEFPVDDVIEDVESKDLASAGVAAVVAAHAPPPLPRHDEMDICTTPPPPEVCEVNDIHLEDDNSRVLGAPDPPKFNGEPSTPPPPIISTLSPKSTAEVTQNFTFGSELASFYSELGSLEEEQQASDVPPSGPNGEPAGSLRLKRPITEPIVATATEEPVKKKTKKRKVPGLNSKLSDISGMVAKWQQVQRDFNS